MPYAVRGAAGSGSPRWPSEGSLAATTNPRPEITDSWKMSLLDSVFYTDPVLPA